MKRIVGVADMFVSDNTDDTIITYALGSCLGIAVYDPLTQVGGLLHTMLPESAVDPHKAKEKPLMFVDTGVPLLFRACYALGAIKHNIQVKVAGGASIKTDSEDDFFQIGKRNVIMLRKLLWKNNIMITACDVGGHQSRTMSLSIATGTVVVRTNGLEKIL
ncbi:MAG: chemotaxis protein CheD [Armatimonadota bacterium]|nr:chemotaxis protein CheD [Armatimonadota bacterium]